MPEIGPVSRRSLIRYLRRLGFTGPRPGSKHQIMDRGNISVRIPNPHRGDISPDLLADIIRQAGIPKEEWRKL